LSKIFLFKPMVLYKLSEINKDKPHVILNLFISSLLQKFLFTNMEHLLLLQANQETCDFICIYVRHPCFCSSILLLSVYVNAYKLYISSCSSLLVFLCFYMITLPKTMHIYSFHFTVQSIMSLSLKTKIF